jgi:hypothetical protein
MFVGLDYYGNIFSGEDGGEKEEEKVLGTPATLLDWVVVLPTSLD